jgi:hypothetical protein
MNACDHVVGYGSDRQGGELLASERERAAQACMEDTKRWLDKGLGARISIDRATERLAKGAEACLAFEYDLFYYCPRCGAKLVQP